MGSMFLCFKYRSPFFYHIFSRNSIKNISISTLESLIRFFRREIQTDDPAAKLTEKEAEYAEKFPNPYRAAQRGFIDEVILPEDTRRKLIKGFGMLENKTVERPDRKHGNIPL